MSLLKKNSPKKVVISQDDKEPVEVQIIAKAILSMSEGISKLTNGPLTNRALVLLIAHASPRYSNGQAVSVTEVRAVLDGISNLKKVYLK